VDEVYEELQPLMFSIAYRMLGSATEAEDIVQEAFLRFHKETTGGTEVDSAKAYLSAVTTRLSIDHLRSARVRRERYVGTWLPEPILTEEEDDVALHAETADYRQRTPDFLSSFWSHAIAAPPATRAGGGSRYTPATRYGRSSRRHPGGWSRPGSLPW
jgi:RNA polymerase sigma factor (sigma-70 family)